MENNRKFISRDGVEYTLTVQEDIIELQPEQIKSIQDEISKLDSNVIESQRGVSLSLWREEQQQKVLNKISEILKDFSFEEIVDLELIDTTFHAEDERISDTEICIERDWDPSTIDYEIAECLKRSYSVEQVRFRFNSTTKESWKNFSFTIKGLKGKNNDSGKIVIYFQDDPIEREKNIMVITILSL